MGIDGKGSGTPETGGVRDTSKEFSAREELSFLEEVSSTYDTEIPYHDIKRDLIIETSKFYMEVSEGYALELGCHDGYETKLLSNLVGHLDVLDGSPVFIEECRKMGLPNVSFIETLFEEYSADRKYDYVFANYVLEHVHDAAVLLGMIKKALKPGGLLFITVPNSQALSRKLALKMGLIQSLDGLTDNDLHHGHRRTYDRESLREELLASGFRIVKQGGIILKILADFQLNQLLAQGFLERKHIEGLYELGNQYPDMCDSVFVVCRVDED